MNRFSEFRVEVTEETGLAEARPAVQVDQRRVGQVAAADQHPLVDTAEPALAHLGDALRDDAAGRGAEWFGSAGASQR